MRVAAIDVGTNSTRLLIAEEHAGGFRSLERRMLITRLGEGVDRSRALAPGALERTFRAIADYAATSGEYGVKRLRVTGTSAVRDARNRAEFFEGVVALTGVEPELLTGEQEARTTFLGAVSDLADRVPTLVVDIGGGSTELVYGVDQPQGLISMDIGCVRLFEKHLSDDPPSESELASMRAEIDDALKEARSAVEVPAGSRLIGVAGTVTQLAALKAGNEVYDPEITHLLVMTHGDVRLLAKRLESLTYEQRKRVKGLDPGRVDVIVSGAEILLRVMESFDAAEVITSEKDLLDGLVLEMLSSETRA